MRRWVYTRCSAQGCHVRGLERSSWSAPAGSDFTEGHHHGKLSSLGLWTRQPPRPFPCSSDPSPMQLGTWHWNPLMVSWVCYGLYRVSVAHPFPRMWCFISICFHLWDFEPMLSEYSITTSQESRWSLDPRVTEAWLLTLKLSISILSTLGTQQALLPFILIHLAFHFWKNLAWCTNLEIPILGHL